MPKASSDPKPSWPNAQFGGQRNSPSASQTASVRVKRVHEHETSIPGVISKVVEFDRKFSDTPYREARVKRNKEL